MLAKRVYTKPNEGLVYMPNLDAAKFHAPHSDKDYTKNTWFICGVIQDYELYGVNPKAISITEETSKVVIDFLTSSAQLLNDSARAPAFAMYETPYTTLLGCDMTLAIAEIQSQATMLANYVTGLLPPGPKLPNLWEYDDDPITTTEDPQELADFIATLKMRNFRSTKHLPDLIGSQLSGTIFIYRHGDPSHWHAYYIYSRSNDHKNVICTSYNRNSEAIYMSAQAIIDEINLSKRSELYFRPDHELAHIFH